MSEFRTPVVSRRMMIGTLSVAAFTLLTAAAPAKPAPARLSATVAANEIGAFVMGKPTAKVRLVEYFSYTCSHCAEFEKISAIPLKSLYVDKGLVVVEYRNLIRDPLDMTAALLARCGGPGAFAANHRAIMLAQPTWLGKVIKMTDAQRAPWYQGSPTERAERIAAGSGLTALMRARGYSAATIKACLDSEVAAAEITGMTNIGQNADHVRATPTFFINGRVVDGSDWPTVKSRLDLAIKGN